MTLIILMHRTVNFPGSIEVNSMKRLKLLFAAMLISVLPLYCFSCKDHTAVNRHLPGDYTSLSDVTAYHGVTYAADAGQLCVYRIENGTETARLNLGEAPNAITLNDDGSILYVVCGGAQGKLICADTGAWKVTNSADIGHTPVDVVYADGFLYIPERFDNTLRKVNAETLETVTVARTVREPAGAAIAGDSIYIAAHLPEEAATAPSVACNVGVYRLIDLSEKAYVDLTNGSTGARGITASPDGRTVYVAHTLGRYYVATTHLDRGWVYTNAVSVIDTNQQKLLATVLLDDIDRGAANPWGILCTEDTLAVTAAGTGEIITLDTGKLLKSILDSENPDDIADILDFTYPFKTRTDLGKSGSRAVALDDSTFIVANYYYGIVQYVDTETLEITDVVDLSTEVPPSDARLGEVLWNDASICYQEWMTCASCHPDGRADALNWDNLNDGMGTPKQARTLLYSFERGRVMATGIRANAAVGINAGIKYICFNDGVTEEQLSQIGAYVRSLEPVESPWLENGTLSEAALRGQELFEGKANCISCHSSAVYGQDVLIENHTQTGNESRGLLVPPIIEVWRTAPYLYDGRAVTIHEVLTTYNPLDENGQTKHGNVSNLTEDELSDLEEFVLSLTEKRTSMDEP